MDDERIELADPTFIPLAPEEAAEAVRLLAALIRAVPARRPDSTFSSRRNFRHPKDLADGSPPAPRRSGKAASADAAGGGR